MIICVCYKCAPVVRSKGRPGFARYSATSSGVRREKGVLRGIPDICGIRVA